MKYLILTKGNSFPYSWINNCNERSASFWTFIL